MNFQMNWERDALIQLYQEFSHICRERKIHLPTPVIELTDSLTHWGQFHPITRSLSLSRRLIQQHSWQQVLGVFKHEIAHYYVFENNRIEFDQRPHGDFFQAACQKLGVPSQYSKASLDLQGIPLDWKEQVEDSTEEKMLARVKKLLSLAQSANEFEAASAMAKVQQLYAQYNLDRSQFSDRSQFVHLVISLKTKRKSVWQQRIISILIEFFFVQIILLQQFNPKTGEKDQAFEMIGTRENVLMAEYVFYFLTTQLELLAERNPVFSRREKASYRLGVLEGFSEKLKPRNNSTESSDLIVSKALIKFQSDPHLKVYLKEIYPRLVNRKSSATYVDTASYKAGQNDGKKINLHRPLEGHQAPDSRRTKVLGTSRSRLSLK